MKYLSLQRIVIAGVGGVFALLLLLGGWFLMGDRLAAKFLPDNPWPALHATTSADPALTQQFADLINKADRINGNAARTFDLSDYPQVYVDDPAVPLNREQAKYFGQIKAGQPGIKDLVKGEGWLSYSQATILNLGSGVRANQVQATLAVQGKTMTADDYRKVGAEVPQPGVTPTFAPSIYGSYFNGYKFKVNFKTVTLDGDRAEVTFIYSDDGKDTHAFLVKTASGWQIAGMRRLPA